MTTKKSMRINIGITATDRVSFLKRCVESLIENTTAEYNLFVSVDGAHKKTVKYLMNNDIKNLKEIFISKNSCGITHSVDTMWNYTDKMYNWFFDDHAAEYFCYLQDDTIVEQKAWLSILIQAYEELHEANKIGFFGGYAPPEHTTMSKIKHGEYTLELKRSARATNLIGTYEHWNRCTMPHRVDGDGNPRGFPTAKPRRGSNFDVFLTGGNSLGKVGTPIASATSNAAQGKYYMCIPGFVKHVAHSKKDSTWNNENKE